jgi:hypothetical protein
MYVIGSDLSSFSIIRRFSIDHAIWAIFYGLREDGARDYLKWFHEVNIPEALSRPGYLWAAHYEAAYPGDRYQKITEARIRSNDPSLASGSGYVALFGGESTLVFFNPSPTQLKGKMDAKSSEMISVRVRPLEYVYVLEWRTEGLESHRSDPRGTPGAAIQMGRFDAPGYDEEVEVWYAQERMVAVSQTPGCMGGRKLLAAMGPQRHGVLYEFTSLEARETHFVSLEETRGTRRFHTVHPPGTHSPFVGRRIWPPA